MIRINEVRIEQVAGVVREANAAGGLNFYSFHTPNGEIIAEDMYPPLNHPATIDFFFFVCMHQFGFWEGDERGYVGPIYGSINGKRVKGSDLLWRTSLRTLRRNEDFFSAGNLASLSLDELHRLIFSDDNGFVNFPDMKERQRITNEFGRFFQNYHTTGGESPICLVVKRANNSKNPGESFLEFLRQVPGYDEDPLQKKNLLLMMALYNRPERFLKVPDDLEWDPIVDYHLMRVSLRLGLVEVSAEIEEQLKRRSWVSEEVERDIRESVRSAVKLLIQLSGRSMSVVDELMWMARRYCPEMEEPKCGKCIFDKVCCHRTKMFQPVFRTTAY